ncbi:hypothetical protein CP976_28360 [Streptomyces coeruleorubidus]|uniref:Uncharacterized protein n=1 Tax=Streptomyces coeruleorubidus TaxID=116188 RepID=A0A5J6I7U6_STRC4|nr:hypothetical protein CP976_28360 [Streptomyces coeruleorubidus]
MATGSITEQERSRILPALTLFETFSTAFVTVRSVKFCALTAHTTVTEKYDGDAARSAHGRTWEAA